MTTHAPMARVPFAPLDNPRLQHLASARNRQNGLNTLKSVSSGKANITPTKNVYKRPFEPSTFDDYDSENVDPAHLTSPSKKSKSDAKPFTCALSLAATSMPPPPTVPSRLTTPIRANMLSPRTPMTAPAGRSPKRKVAGINKSRCVSAPFTRIDPPFAASRGSSLPFSLDAALSGTFSAPTPAAAKNSGLMIQESMPKTWFFDVYEDSPEEEAANLMEHSTLTLDLSSDEESSKKAKNDRGKENCPPKGYEAGVASRPASSAVESLGVGAPRYVKKGEIVRKKVVTDEMDDGERSPLSDLEAEPFFPVGLDKNSHIIVDPVPEKCTPAGLAEVDASRIITTSSTEKPAKMDINTLFAAPVSFASGPASNTKSSPPGLLDMPLVDAAGDIKGEIIVWEDSPVSERAVTPVAGDVLGQSWKDVEVYDENTAPVANVWA